MRSLVIGASGQVGALLHASASGEESCTGTYCHHPSPGLVPLDLCDGLAVRKIIGAVRPEVCYVPGALTSVDYAETHAGECRQTNVEGISHVARAMAEIGGVLVFFSTEHVFDESSRAWTEDDPLSPQSVYAKSKVEAEKTAREILPNDHLILRTSWVFGPDPQAKNFSWRVRRTLERNERLIVPSDQYGQPTYGPDLARAAHELVRRGARGTYHVVGPQCLSRLEWAKIIARTLHLPAELIEGRPTTRLGLPAPRPLQIQLDRTKLLSFFGHDPIRPPLAGIASHDMVQEYELAAAGIEPATRGL
jgi:dTDP-4-dehydrorhamnose reductase